MKTTILTIGALGLASVLGSGCRSSPLKDRYESVNRDLYMARAAGAPVYAAADYQSAEHTLYLAHESDEAANSARQRAEDARDDAKEELAGLAKQRVECEATLEDTESALAGAESRLAKLQRREAQLQARGLSEDEIDRVLGDQTALAEHDVRTARATIGSCKAELEHIGAREKELKDKLEAASAGISAAGQQLLEAGALCDKAGAAARQAEARAIAKRKSELKVN